MEQFAKLGLSSGILSVLKAAGFLKPTEIQEKAIPLAIAGKDIIGSSATGSGKTLAFASSIIENLKPNDYVQALIMTPTRELAEQVATSISHFSKNKHLNVLAVYGGVDISGQIRKISHADILVGTPGRILDHLQRRTLRLDYIKFLVLDEVDRMFDMGFRHDVETIIKQCPVNRQTMMFSATISSDLDYLAKKYTKDSIDISVESFVDHSKLKQIYYDVEPGRKFSLLFHLLKKEDSELAMIFCSTRRNADFVAENLRKAGIKAKVIHGGLVQNKRLNVLKEFHEKGFNVLVCTDVAARGLDIKCVSHIYNYDLPTGSNDYIHRIGRTARAGENGKVINLLSNRDYENFSNILKEEALKIDSEQLPSFETVMIRLDSSNHRGKFGNREHRSGLGDGGDRFRGDRPPRKSRFGNNRGNHSKKRNYSSPRGSNRRY